MDEGSETKAGDTDEEDEDQGTSVPCIDVHAIRTFLGSNHCKFGTDTVNWQVSCSSVSSISSYPVPLPGFCRNRLLSVRTSILVPSYVFR